MNEAEKQAMAKLYAACAEFVRKCDVGEARSVRSYAQMKEAMAFYDALKEAQK